MQFVEVEIVLEDREKRAALINVSTITYIMKNRADGITCVLGRPGDDGDLFLDETYENFIARLFDGLLNKNSFIFLNEKKK